MNLDEQRKKWCDTVAIWLRTQLQSVELDKSEIELRFGVYANASKMHTDNSDHNSADADVGAFVSGVDVRAWQRVRTMFACMDRAAHAKPPESTLEVVSVYYDDGNSSSSKGNVWRKIERADGTVTRERKTKISQQDYVFREQQTNRLIGARLSHSLETPLGDNETCDDALLEPSLVRVRARTSYWHKMWRIDLTLVQQGSNRKTAASAPALYEIEIELLPQLIDWSKHDFHYLALSLLLKIKEISESLTDAVHTVATALPQIVYQKTHNHVNACDNNNK